MKDAGSAASMVTEGEILAGRYRIAAALGRGGMGAVFAATDLTDGARVAVKVLLSEAADDVVQRARFEREARAVRQLASEHVARVLDVGTSGVGAPFIVMELLEGEDLEHLAARAGPLPARDVAEIARQACEALAEAHAIGIIHRDIKPRNLFVSRHRDGTPHVKVLDFGISKWLEIPEQTELTRTAEVIGTPHYMSPEQLSRPRDVDARTDVWALGATMYRLLAGQRPFDAETIPHVCARVLNAKPEPLARVRLDLPAELVAVIERCLEKEPAARFPTVGALSDALRPFLALAPSVVVSPSAARSSAGRRPRPETPTASASIQRGQEAPEAKRPEVTAPWSPATPSRPKPPLAPVTVAFTAPVGVAAPAAVVAPAPLRWGRALPAALALGGALALGAAVLGYRTAAQQTSATSAAPAATARPSEAGASAAATSLPASALPDAHAEPPPGTAASLKRPRRPKPSAPTAAPAPVPPPAPAMTSGPPDVRH